MDVYFCKRPAGSRSVPTHHRFLTALLQRSTSSPLEAAPFPAWQRFGLLKLLAKYAAEAGRRSCDALLSRCVQGRPQLLEHEVAASVSLLSASCCSKRHSRLQFFSFQSGCMAPQSVGESAGRLICSPASEHEVPDQSCCEGVEHSLPRVATSTQYSKLESLNNNPCIGVPEVRFKPSHLLALPIELKQRPRYAKLFPGVSREYRAC